MAGRTWLAVALACLVWFGYLKWFAPPMTPAPSATATPTPAATNAATPSPKGDAFTTAFGRGGETILSNKDLKLSFSDVGGRPFRGELFSHRVSIKKDSPLMAPVTEEENPIDFATLFTDPELKGLAEAKYKATAQGNSVRFETTQGKVGVTKDYDLPVAGHFIDAKIRLRLPADKRTDWGYLYLPLGGKDLAFEARFPLSHWEAVAFVNGSAVRNNLDKLKEEEVVQGSVGWAAFGNRYFATAIVNRSATNPDVVFTKRPGFSGLYLRFPLVAKADQKELEYSLRLFVGPKDVEELSRVEGMKNLVDYGTFKIFAYPLLELMRLFHRLFHNWGVAIILLTLLVRVLFYPLSLKSYRSMKGMQKLQPQIKALKEKYKDDMARFNQEQMALFKAHKVNPMGGCLPMLVQLPVFFALYTVLSNSIDLFHAPFFGWILDLSDKDPFYVLPVLMGISMFLQQKMTPAAGLDPMQQKMMLAMPVVFSFIMLNLPSGLTLYIFLSTLMGIGQQLLINREGNGPAAKLAVSRS